jgi:hypothetical protein
MTSRSPIERIVLQKKTMVDWKIIHVYKTFLNPLTTYGTILRIKG